MNEIIKSTLITIEKSKSLLSVLSDEELSSNSISPYYSSIGSHIRHIYDFYDCSLKIDDKNFVDLTARQRIKSIENNCNSALDYIDELIDRIKNIDFDIDKEIIVIDDLGTGRINIKYTFSALLAQANSHTIHHYAIINYILDRLNIKINVADFGYNPTTPKVAVSN